MSNSEETCPYCSVKNPTTTIAWSTKVLASFLGIFGLNASQKTSVKSLEIKCLQCEREYVLVKFGDLEWVKSQIDWESDVRDGMIKLFGSSLSRDRIIDNIQGIALRKDKTLDICFKYGRKRAYMSCVKESGKYMGVYLEEITL